MIRKNTPLLILIFVALVIFLVTSCDKAPRDPFPQTKPHRTELDNTSEYFDQHYKVYTFEGCEYILVGVGKYQWGSHKGNCSNPIHKQQ